MSMLKVIKSPEFAQLAADFRQARSGEDRLTAQTHPPITTLNGHPTGAPPRSGPLLEIQPEPNLHVISMPRCPTLRHPYNHAPTASHADRPRQTKSSKFQFIGTTDNGQPTGRFGVLSHRGRGSSVKPPSNPDDLTPVSLSEVQTLVKSLKTRKAPGLDGISNKVIKCFPLQLLSLLVAILTRAFKLLFSLRLEEKEGGIHKPETSRPPASLIIDEQFGFRPAHSCPQQVLRLVEYATEGFKRKNKTVAVFFDVAKAFDRSRSSSRLRPLLYPRTLTTYRVRRPASNSRFADDTALFYSNRNGKLPQPPPEGH
ncbi:Probable RNA-directed DNA polymerase from transposon BS [Eumeta japonica]|uniref:Probable RNA-directed DNA polymerase from transposon BS n=1 Tax=Eumeta variegata TaxID=151549 RepID=A0A4C1SDL9_EUMVA|nr:Probable RNA-directed DNA polymerase from transposon BS [Eumeta japonica]